MALYLFGEPSYRPSRLLDQHFGLDLEPEDLISPMLNNEFRNLLRQCPAGYMRPWRSQASQRDSGSTVSYNKDNFEANLDVQQFKPEEISVKVNDEENMITIEGKHEEKQDEHGFISRQFVRRYVLPKGHDVKRIESKLSSDGILTISAPKVNQEQLEHRSIPVVQTGKPSKPIEQKKEEKPQQGDKKQ